MTQSPELPNDELPVVAASGLVVLSRAQPQSVLLLKHKDRWDLPKGHAEEGEELLETAVRETEEETGILRAALDIDSDFRFDIEYELKNSKRGRYLKRVSYFLAHTESESEIQLTEHIGYEWFEWPPERIQAQTIDPLLLAVKQHLDSNTNS